MSRTITDKYGRTWEYNNCEGTWEHGGKCIGCGGKNGRKWMNWNNKGAEEFTTLAEAMESTRDRATIENSHEIRKTVANIMALVKQHGSYNLTGEDKRVITYFEDTNGYHVLHDLGIHKMSVVIESL
jgi:hypothetical protein